MTSPQRDFCIACPEGTTSHDRAEECASGCYPGEFMSGKTCLPCPAGTMPDGVSAARCLFCPANHYAPANSTRCTVCPPGHVAREGAADEEASTHLVPGGHAEHSAEPSREMWPRAHTEQRVDLVAA